MINTIIFVHLDNSTCTRAILDINMYICSLPQGFLLFFKPLNKNAKDRKHFFIIWKHVANYKIFCDINCVESKKYSTCSLVSLGRSFRACAPWMRSHLWPKRSRTSSSIIVEPSSSIASSVSPSLFPLSVLLGLILVSAAPSTSAIFLDSRPLFVLIKFQELTFGMLVFADDIRLFIRFSNFLVVLWGLR